MSDAVKQAILTRRSVRAYRKEPVSRDELKELLEAGRLAPSSLNSQPWRFKVVTDPEDIAWFGTSEATRKQAWLAGVGAIIVCCADLDTYVKDSQSAAFFYRENKLMAEETISGVEAYVANQAAADEQAKFGACAMNVALAVSFMMLRAVELGLATCWIGMFIEANIKARLSIPAGWRIVNLLAVGHPDPDAPMFERKRKDLDEIVML